MRNVDGTPRPLPDSIVAAKERHEEMLTRLKRERHQALTTFATTGSEMEQGLGLVKGDTPAEVEDVPVTASRDALFDKLQGKHLPEYSQEPQALPQKRKFKPRGKGFTSVYQPRWGRKG